MAKRLQDISEKVKPSAYGEMTQSKTPTEHIRRHRLQMITMTYVLKDQLLPQDIQKLFALYDRKISAPLPSPSISMQNAHFTTFYRAAMHT